MTDVIGTGTCTASVGVVAAQVRQPAAYLGGSGDASVRRPAQNAAENLQDREVPSIGRPARESQSQAAKAAAAAKEELPAGPAPGLGAAPDNSTPQQQTQTHTRSRSKSSGAYGSSRARGGASAQLAGKSARELRQIIAELQVAVTAERERSETYLNLLYEVTSGTGIELWGAAAMDADGLAEGGGMEGTTGGEGGAHAHALSQRGGAGGGGEQQQHQHHHQQQQQQQQVEEDEALVVARAAELAHYARDSRSKPIALGSNLAVNYQELIDQAVRQGASMWLKERAMNMLSEGITIADARLPDMPLVFANDAFYTMTGYGVDDTLGRNCRFLQGEGTDPAQIAKLRKGILAGERVSVQMQNYKKDGTPFVNYLSLTPILDAAGNLTHFVGIQSDISELVRRREAEATATAAALEAEAATELKSRFLATMSHEIRTPLNGMIGVTQLLEATPLTREQRDLVSTVSASSESLLSIVNDILDFSKIEADKLIIQSTPFNLQRVIDAAVDIAGLRASEKRIHLAYRVCPSTPLEMLGDANRLQQVLLNLLNNAIKFTETGEVLLEVSANAETARPADSTTTASEERADEGHEVEMAQPDSKDKGKTPMDVDRPETDGMAAVPLPSSRQPGTRHKTTAAPASSGSGAQPVASGDGTNAPPVGGRAVVLRFLVKDTGIGISQEGLKKLFRSFTQVDSTPTRRYGGSGLGLVISKRLTESMGGSMWAESAGVNKGSTFTFTIRTALAAESTGRPSGSGGSGFGGQSASISGAGSGGVIGAGDGVDATAATQTVVPHRQTSLSSPSLNNDTGLGLRRLRVLDGRRVVVAEESENVRNIICEALALWGADVESVPTEEEALELLQSEGASGAARGEIPAGERAEAGGGSEDEDEDDERAMSPTSARGYDAVIFPASFKRAAQHIDPRRAVCVAWPGEKAPLLRGGARPAASMHRPFKQLKLHAVLAELLADMHAPHEAVDGAAAAAAAVGAVSTLGEVPVSAAKNAAAGSSAALPAKAHAAAAAGGSDTPTKILFVEDNFVNLKVGLAMLRKVGYSDVKVAHDGLEALQLLKDEPRGAFGFDLVLMDLNMPNMGGIEAVQEIRRLWPGAIEMRQDAWAVGKLRVIAVSADALESTKSECKNTGFAGWLPKPFRMGDLSGQIRAQMEDRERDSDK